MIRLDRWQALTAAERPSSAPLCLDLVVELASPSDEVPGVNYVGGRLPNRRRTLNA